MWWGGRPRHCLKIGADELVWAEVGRGWTGCRHDRCVIRPLEPGAIRVSPVEPNLLQPAAVHEQVRSLVGPPRRLRVVGRVFSLPVPLPIILLLPDVCVRTAVFELDRVPRRADEREALVRWRFGQDHLFPIAGAKVYHQLLPGGAQRDAIKRTAVLAAAVHERVLEQYEELCAAANLVPVQITTASFQLCNLWFESRPKATAATADPDVLWVSLLDHTFSVLAFHGGRLVFTRSKLLPGWDAAGQEAWTAADRAATVSKEMVTSMQVWQETGQHGTEPRMVLAVDQSDTDLARALQEELQIPIEVLDWNLFRQLGWAKRMQQLPLAAMPAVAGLC